MLAAGTQLGRYEISAPLGAGGMGEVYRATDSRLDRQVAIKVLPPQFVQDQARLARFEREAKVVAALSHPNILGIHDFGTEQGQTFAVMELLEGETLRRRIDDAVIPWRKAVEIALAIADGLTAAHSKGIIHRDLKPDNVFLTADERVKVLDFGLARIEPSAPSSGDSPTGTYHPAQTEAGVILGTVGYMAPEQVRGRDVDARSDIFSLGCVLYEMVTGGRAFARQSAVETMAAILHDEPPELTDSVKSVPLELNRVIRHCLEKSREARFQTARDLAFALKAMLSDSNASSPRLLAPRAAQRPLAFWIVAACVLLGIAVASALLLVPRLRDVAATNPAGTTGQLFDSLAILPLVNVTGDPKGEPLCEGIAEHLSGRLALVGNLKVRPITSTSRYRDQQADAKTVGRELNVNAVVTGRLRQDGETLVISLNLVDARDDSLVWSKGYPGNRQQILDLQDDMARDLASKLGLHPTSDERQRLTKRHTENPSAYMLYTEGKFHFNKFTPDGLQTGTEFFQRALDADPNYAPALAGVGRCKVLLGTLHLGPKQTHPEARQLFHKALEIDANLADAHAGLGAIHLFHDWDWPAAERELTLAIAGSGWISWPIYGFWQATQGRLPEALEAIKRGQELDPAAAPRRNELAQCYNWMRRYPEAIAEANNSIELDAKFPLAYTTLGVAYVQQGQPQQAIAKLQTAIDAGHRHPGVVGTLGCAYAAAGQTDEAQKTIAQLKELSPGRYGFAMPIARIYSALGDNDRAFEWLNKACEEHDSGVIWLKVDPTFDNLRTDRRFDELLQKMRLADKPAIQDQGIQSVAVLPLENIGGDPKTEFLSDGLADQIINSLLQVRRQNFKVRPFTSVSRYKGQKPSVQVIARDLNVQAIVMGSLHQQGDDLSIGIELVDAREDNVLWSKRYRGQLGGILDLQDQIARDVAANLRLRLTGEEQQHLTKRHTQDPEAYLLYREGMYHWHKFTEEGLKTGIEYFERAVRKDQNYAPAYMGLGMCYQVLGCNHWPPKENLAKATGYLETALTLDGSLATAHAALGMDCMLRTRDWPAAERHLQRALQIDPRSFAAHNLYGYYLAAMGQVPEAIAALRQAVEAEPLAPVASDDLAMMYYLARQYDQAIAQCQKTIEFAPQFPFTYETLGLAHAQQGVFEAAVEALQKAVTLRQDHVIPLAMLGNTYARWGKRDEAEKLLQQFSDLATSGRFASGLNLATAMIQVGLGRNDQAIQSLRKAVEAGEPWLIKLKVDPLWDNLRSDPRFDVLLQQMGLGDKPKPTRSASEGSPAPLDTLAILPFDNQSPDPEAGYLGDDITYSLTDSLARVRELKVRPYSSAARFKAGSSDAKTAGRDLQVQAVLRGSIQNRGETVVIDVELIHVGEDRRLWGNRYQGKLAERLTLQQQIIQEVPEKLRLSLTGQDKQALAKAPTPSLKAHELYIQGRLEWNKRTVQGLEKSMDLYRQAIDQDPKFALAMAGLAEAYFVFPINTDSPPKDSMLKAKAAAIEALEIDNQLVEAHTTLGAIASAFEWDWAEADRRFERALAINPNNQFARYRYAQHLTTMGRFAEAHVHGTRARELDPFSLIIRAVTGRHFYYAHQYDAAIEQYRFALNIDPNFWVARLFLGRALTQQGKYEEAVGELQRARDLPGGNLEAQATLGHLYAVMGRAAEARRVLDELRKLSQQRHVPPYYFAIIHAALGEKDQALDELDKAYEDRNFFVSLLRFEPMLDNLRDHPRFQKIIASMNFPPSPSPEPRVPSP